MNVFVIFLIVAGRLIHQTEAVLNKRYVKKYANGGMIFTAIFSLFSMLFFLATDLISDRSGLRFTAPLLLCGAAAGLGFCFASYLAFEALNCGSFVLTKLVLSYGVLIPVVYGLCLGEKLTVFGWIGLALILVSLFLIRGSESGVKITKKWVVVIVLSIVSAGVFSILQRHQQILFSAQYDNEFMIVTLSVSAVCLFAIGIVKDGKNLGRIVKTGFPYAMGAGLSNGATNFISLYVYTLAPISLVSPIGAGVDIVLSFCISKLLYKEKFSGRQYAGVVLGGIALVLFNL